MFWASVARSAVPQRSQTGMVVSAHPLASEAGVEMLQAGGNAVDAAVATTLAISVVEPFSAGIGGGGFLLLYPADTGEMKALDFRERAPAAATRQMYLDEAGNPISRASLDGHRAAGVPGTVAGLAAVHRQYGTLPWRQVVAPAIRLAEEGFPVSQRFVEAVDRRQEMLLGNPAAREAFTRDGEAYRVGDRLIQPDLAETLERIAADPQSFYTGEIAGAIADDMAANGGLVTREDLAAYEPIWREPICGDFRRWNVCSMPPPSSGGVHLLQILNLMGDTDLAALGWHHPDALHLLIESMKIAYADRAEYLGDPDFVEVPVRQLVSGEYARQRRSEITMDRARNSEEVKPMDAETLERLRESPDTSHLTVVDGDRNAVSLTFTVNGGFGAGVVAEGTGILLNNEMDDFAIAPGVPNLFGLVGGEANAIAPRKTPLSSMTPTIVTENGELRLALGSPGGSTIITTVLQILLNVLVYDMDVAAAVSAPRIHQQWLPETVAMESWGLDALTVEELRRRGHDLVTWGTWGNASAIEVMPDGTLEGAADRRGDGEAVGF
ncbi:MAG TPA: gamma-glutamyltransferase [Oscillatoriales cyanobacterium M59_W2019_021]|nr:gamma-glutamyltransferase [Oscillatoriales cyanobacterium M4454_W2019_049]HIK50064.1 gamma-glutamyltransferase [Oscillatoriales cyanobacterium M59_W2019_021]